MKRPATKSEITPTSPFKKPATSTSKKPAGKTDKMEKEDATEVPPNDPVKVGM